MGNPDQPRNALGRFASAERVEKQQEPGVEVGSTGLKRHGGRIDEEYLAELRGARGAKVYEEMRSNDGIVGGILFAINMWIRSVDWTVEDGGTSPADVAAAEFLSECRDDMDHSWADMISEILTMLPFGWSFLEVVYKRRRGYVPAAPVVESGIGEVEPPTPSSKYDDNRIGWHKVELRGQNTLLSWVFDRTGAPRAMIQQAPPDYQVRVIPIEYGLLFRTRRERNNPEGWSILRNAYRPWWFKRRIEEIEAIGVERDLAGLPVVGVPLELFSDDGTDAEKTARAAKLEEWIDLARNVRRDEQEGIVKPNVFDEGGNNLYTVELLSSGGTRQFDTSGIVRRKNEEMALSVLMDWLLLGHEQVGSFALATSKTSSSVQALSAWVGMIEEEINRTLVPELFRQNQIAVDTLPRIVAAEIDEEDLEALAGFLKTLSDAGMELFPNDVLRRFLLETANLPAEGFDEAAEPLDAPGLPAAPTDAAIEGEA